VTVRIYVPSTLGRLREAVAGGTGAVVPAGSAAYAVTGAARAVHAGRDEEELEYLAMTAAALESPDLLEEREPPRRLVIAVDVDAAEPVEAGEPFDVRAGAYHLPDDVAAYHLDSAEAEQVVAAARSAWKARGPGWEDAVTRTAEHELGWYAPSELQQLLEVRTRRR
jgi:hypothetical protein